MWQEERVVEMRSGKHWRGYRNFRQGVQPSEKKNLTKRGEGEGFGIYSALVCSKSNLAIQTAFQTVTFMNMTYPCDFQTQKHIFDMIDLAY